MKPADHAAKPEMYNARVAAIRRAHDDLMILRVLPDSMPRPILAGQYTVLGLGSWERRIDGVRPSTTCGSSGVAGQLIRRAYSISCPILDEAGKLVTIRDLPYLEFYFNRIGRPSDEPPILTPRLFALNEGDRLHIGSHVHGRYTVEAIRGDEDVVFAATGTGEAPHNAMVAELLRRGHSGRLTVVTCARRRRDLAYLDVHRELERRFKNYRYVALTTREPENTDRMHPKYVGKRYLQDLFASEHTADTLGFPLDASRVHVYVCGAPAMIGLPIALPDGSRRFPEPAGMVEVLVSRGFRLDELDRRGNIHFERYW